MELFEYIQLFLATDNKWSKEMQGRAENLSEKMKEPMFVPRLAY